VSLKEHNDVLFKSNSINDVTAKKESITKMSSSGNLKARYSVVKEEASEDMSSQGLSPGKDTKMSHASSRRFFEKSVHLLVEPH
jgi:hypothetical protein